MRFLAFLGLSLSVIGISRSGIPKGETTDKLSEALEAHDSRLVQSLFERLLNENKKAQLASEKSYQLSALIVLEQGLKEAQGEVARLKEQQKNTNFKLAAVVANLPSYKFLGCYRDTGEHDLGLPLVRFTVNAMADCSEYCDFRKTRFFALQDGSACTCGDSYGKYGPARNCDHPCPGNKFRNCGGDWANMVYELLHYA